MNLEGKKVLVVGLGKTGESVCRFLLDRQARVQISEGKPSEQISDKIRQWTQRGVEIEAGGHRRSSFMQADMIVPSPGVPPIPELTDAMAHGVEVVSEVELAFRYIRGRIIGITGSNGKSTTATLCHEILVKGGRKAFLAGNIGTPLISFVDSSKDDHIYVTELSSFQLEYAKHFRASVSIFLNITPDHLDWHKSFDDYFSAKKRLFKNQNRNDTAILNGDDPLVWNLREEIRPHIYGFSRMRAISPGCYIDKDRIVFSDDGKKTIMNTNDVHLPGVHNQENIMAALCVGHLLHVPSPVIKTSVEEFEGLEHRLEKVATLEGVTFYNDSKATNVGAALKSIQSFDQKIILILGGRDKGGTFEALKKSIALQVKKIFLLGEAKEKIAGALKNGVPMSRVSSLREAVESGFAAASPGDVVLLAPACTSYDMFANFEERGKIFKQEVLSLKKRIAEKGVS
ncbi:MAG: UDP-N-acetylmuramoyl-L-alanine--D-glutamate ligase [Candidatus Aminicenantes bacterium]|nr:UDP-N-acetylmuramoyl-L-alanine--D-glutamate ligase [Candidatus Aminicenantes bacterium]